MDLGKSTMKLLIHIEKVMQNYVFDPEVSLYVQTLKRVSKKYFVLIIHNVIVLFHSCVGDILKVYPFKEGGFEKYFGRDVEFLSKRDHDRKRFFSTKWPDLRINHFQDGGYDVIMDSSQTSNSDGPLKDGKGPNIQGPIAQETPASLQNPLLVFIGPNIRAQADRCKETFDGLIHGPRGLKTFKMGQAQI